MELSSATPQLNTTTCHQSKSGLRLDEATFRQIWRKWKLQSGVWVPAEFCFYSLVDELSCTSSASSPVLKKLSNYGSLLKSENFTGVVEETKEEEVLFVYEKNKKKSDYCVFTSRGVYCAESDPSAKEQKQFLSWQSVAGELSLLCRKDERIYLGTDLFLIGGLYCKQLFLLLCLIRSTLRQQAKEEEANVHSPFASPFASEEFAEDGNNTTTPLSNSSGTIGSSAAEGSELFSAEEMKRAIDLLNYCCSKSSSSTSTSSPSSSCAYPSFLVCQDSLLSSVSKSNSFFTQPDNQHFLFLTTNKDKVCFSNSGVLITSPSSSSEPSSQQFVSWREYVKMSSLMKSKGHINLNDEFSFSFDRYLFLTLRIFHYLCTIKIWQETGLMFLHNSKLRLWKVLDQPSTTTTTTSSSSTPPPTRKELNNRTQSSSQTNTRAKRMSFAFPSLSILNKNYSLLTN